MADSPLKDTITTNAGGPASISNDTGSASQHNLKDQIEADRYLAANKAARTKGLGLKINKLRQAPA